MKLLITGANGMLGQALCNELIDKYEVIGTVKKGLESRIESLDSKEFRLLECDICDEGRVKRIFNEVSADIIIHTAAYTDVDGCELDPQKAYSVNSLGTRNVVSADKEARAVLVYISTDYVFDGTKRTPYIESDKTCPINIYGKSKFEGERHVETTLNRFFIFRTSWLFGKGGKNFVDTITSRTKSGGELKIVNDQRGSPTWTKDLASGIRMFLDLYSRNYLLGHSHPYPPPLRHVKNPREGRGVICYSEKGPIDSIYGIYHLTNSGNCSWYEFTKTILDYAGIKDVKVSPVTTRELNRPANRPAMSILDNTKYEKLVGTRLMPWQEALKKYLQESITTG